MPKNIVINITGKSIAWLLMAGALIWLLKNVSSILLLLFIAILLAVAITPLVERLQRQRLPRPLAIVVIYVGLLAIFSVALAILIPVLVDETTQLSTSLPKLTQSMLNLPEKWIPGLAQNLQLADLATQLSAQLGAVVGSVGALLVQFGQTLSTLIFSALLVLVVGFILTSDAAFAPHFIARFFPPDYRPTASILAREIGRRLGHWVRAQLLVCLFYGACFGVGLGLMGVPYAFALGLAAGFMELIPYVGGLIVTTLAFLVAISISPWLALGVVILYLVVSTIEANILYPKVVGDIVGLHPLVIIIALFIGAEAGGVMGALLAVPFTVVLQVLFEQFYRFDEPAPVVVEVPVIVPVPEGVRADPAPRKA